jgi:Tfp pilus assembly protein PilX
MRGFALVVTLVMVALLAIIAIGVLSSVSVERTTAVSYTNRYQAELAAQNGLQAAAKTLAATPTGASSITGTDTFLVVRADGPPDANGNKAAYYYLAKPNTPPAPSSITYYPLFSSSTDPSAPAIQTTAINLTAQDAGNPLQDPTKPFAPLVPAH